MKFMRCVAPAWWFAGLLGCLGVPGSAFADEPAVDNELAVNATEILRKYCYKCHGVEFKVPGYNVLDRASLVASRGADEDPYITPGQPDKSTLWDRMGKDEPETGDKMPPAKSPQPSADEVATIRKWIEGGAPFPTKITSRAFISDEAVLKTVVEHLRGIDPDEAQYWRYFTLETLHNNPRVRDDEIRLARAAVSKLVNSLSNRPSIVVPEVLGPGGTVMAVDIRRLGWLERDVWNEILRVYPYGLKFTRRREAALRRLAEELDRIAGDDVGLPYIRADWFVDQASRPPLYHTLLDLPTTAQALERTLGVNVENDFMTDTLRRAGFARSGVSRQNRLVDRHETTTGAYYWKSYDFRHDDGPGNIFRFPLGPAFPANPFRRQAFEHAGGELIFSLPNKLQGYLLVTNEGKRIDDGPPDIVGDDNKSSGTTQIVNGLSCIGCHRLGMKPFTDELRESAAIEGKPRIKLERLVPDAAEWKRLLDADEAQFLRAEEAATGPFLRVDRDQSKAIREFPEPITTVAHLLYQRELGPEDMAAELNIPSTDALLTLIRSNSTLRRLGLAPLLNNGAVKRPEWDSLRQRALSSFHQVANEIDRGTPFRKF